MRNSQLIFRKTVCLADVIKQAKNLLLNKNPYEVFKIIQDQHFKNDDLNIKVLFDNQELAKQIAESIPGDLTGRVLLTCDRGSRNHQYELASECNGVVIDFATWDILSYPPAALSFNMPKATIIECFKEKYYDVYHADYGTIVTLYYYGGKWNMSTSNSYEIDNMIWVGQFTFRQLLDEILQNENIDLETLDRDYCHTIGFHHDEYHKFNGCGQNPKRAWFVRSVNLKTHMAIYKNNLLRLPMQNIDPSIMKSIEVGNYEKVYNAMNTKCELALTNYFNNKNTVPFFGYILKSNRPDIIADAFMESSLQEKIRLMVCQRPPSDIVHVNRFDWMVMNSMFNPNLNAPFKQLFGQSKVYIELYDQIINQLSSDITRDFNKDINGLRREIKFFIEELNNRNIDVNKRKISKEIIKNFLYNPIYIPIYIKLREMNERRADDTATSQTTENQLPDQLV